MIQGNTDGILEEPKSTLKLFRFSDVHWSLRTIAVDLSQFHYSYQKWVNHSPHAEGIAKYFVLVGRSSEDNWIQGEIDKSDI